jgi:hypothetical protein
VECSDDANLLRAVIEWQNEFWQESQNDANNEGDNEDELFETCSWGTSMKK